VFFIVLQHTKYILTAAGSEQTQLTFRTPGPPDTQAATRLHKSACQPPHHKGRREQIERGHPGGVNARGGAAGVRSD